MEKKGKPLQEKTSFEAKVGLAEMLKGGVIIDVMTPEQARIAEDAGAIAVMATDASACCMPSPEITQKIQESVSIPVMAKCRIGHFVEAQILEALFIDFIDESELLTPADTEYHINKQSYRIPFVCGYSNLTEALRRIEEGAAMVRTKGQMGVESIADTVRQLRSIKQAIRSLSSMDKSELLTEASRMGVSYSLVEQVAKTEKLPVPNFAAGGITTPADAALMMQLGAESLFIGSSLFKSENPQRHARAIVEAVAYHGDPLILAKISTGPIEFLTSLDAHLQDELLTSRGEYIYG